MKVAIQSLIEPPEHEIDHGEVNKGDAGLSQNFVVFGKTAVSVEPGKGSLDNPTSGQDLKAFDIVRAQHGSQDEVKAKRNPVKNCPR